MGNFLKLSELRTYISAAATLLKADIHSDPLPTFLVKYRIYSGETDAARNITIHKITKRIESNTVLDVTDDKVLTHLLINISCIVIVVDLGFSFQNAPQSMILDFCKYNFIDVKYNT